MKIVFATHNLHKLKEIKAILPGSIELLSLTDINCHEDIPETSGTIEGNALQKAQYVKQHFGYDCFADDTGLEVDSLNGAPGVLSARYAGPQKKDADNVAKLLTDLEGNTQRNAHFKTVIAYVTDQEEKTFTGICKGEILSEIRGENGFGYDPIFLPKGKDESFAEMSSEEKNQISHRALAVQKLVEYFHSKDLA